MTTTNQANYDLSLVIDNHEQAYNHALSLAAAAVEQAPSCEQVTDGIWTVEQAKRFLLADALKEWADDLVDDLPVDKFRGALVAQLVRSALSNADWHDLACTYLAQLDDDGTNGQDRSDYTDDQDRQNYHAV